MAGEQAAANIIVAIKRESTPGVAAGATGATRVRLTGGGGMKKTIAIAASAEKRSDGNRQKGRHSGVSVAGDYDVELTEGGFVDMVIESVMRSTESAADSDAFAGVFTSIAIASNVFTATGGSFITAGYRVGQVIYCTGMEDVANDNVNCMVLAVTASTMTVLPAKGVALTDNAADTAGTFNRRGNVINATPPVAYHHTVDEFEQDNVLSEQFLGCKIVGFSMTITPNQPITMSVRLQGIDSVDLLTGASPYFTTPALTTGLALVADDLTLRYNGAVVTLFTSLTLNFNVEAEGINTLGTKITPDVFTGDLVADATATRVRDDHSQIILRDDETEFEIFTLLEDRSQAAPFPCYGIALPVVTVDDITAPKGGGSGPMIETMTLGLGTKPAGVTGYDATVAVFSSSGIA